MRIFAAGSADDEIRRLPSGAWRMTDEGVLRRELMVDADAATLPQSQADLATALSAMKFEVDVLDTVVLVAERRLANVHWELARSEHWQPTGWVTDHSRVGRHLFARLVGSERLHLLCEGGWTPVSAGLERLLRSRLETIPHAEWQ